jgi:hypothetical protein
MSLMSSFLTAGVVSARGASGQLSLAHAFQAAKHREFTPVRQFVHPVEFVPVI